MLIVTVSVKQTLIAYVNFLKKFSRVDIENFSQFWQVFFELQR